VPATLLGGWTTAALGASLMATGRNKLVLGLLIATFIVLISGELSLKLLTPSVLSDAVGNAIVHGFLTASAIALILTGAGLHILAWRRNMTSPATLLAAGSAWLLLTSVILVERARHPSEPLTTYLLVIAAAALCVTPPAAAPLALAWNRNR
jgi:hypothetical protein